MADPGELAAGVGIIIDTAVAGDAQVCDQLCIFAVGHQVGNLFDAHLVKELIPLLVVIQGNAHHVDQLQAVVGLLGKVGNFGCVSGFLVVVVGQVAVDSFVGFNLVSLDGVGALPVVTAQIRKVIAVVI